MIAAAIYIYMYIGNRKMKKYRRNAFRYKGRPCPAGFGAHWSLQGGFGLPKSQRCGLPFLLVPLKGSIRAAIRDLKGYYNIGDVWFVCKEKAACRMAPGTDPSHEGAGL